MLYYEMMLENIPQVRFACSASTDHYRNFFDHKGTMEITTVEGCALELTVDGKTYEVPPQSVLVFMPDSVCSLRAKGDGTVCDDTIAMDMGALRYSLLDSETDGIPAADKGDSVLLPMLITPGDDYANISRLIRTFISCYMRESSSANCRCLSLWFELLGALHNACGTALTGGNIAGSLPSSQMYVRKAKNYIEANYSKKLLIPDIAAELRITPNYLSSMFKQITGKTVLDYLHMVRIQAVKEQLQQPRLPPLSEIAAQNGFANTRSLCSLFRRSCGVSIKEYLRISRELTVYHRRPWDEITEGKT